MPSVDELPAWSAFATPTGLPAAARRIDQGTLLEKIGRSHRLSRERLLPVVQQAVRAGAITAVSTQLPDRGTVTVVDETTLQADFDRFVGDQPAYSLRHTVGLRWFVSSLRRPAAFRRLLKDLLSVPRVKGVVSVLVPSVLRIGERFGSSPEWLFRLISYTPLRPSQHQSEIARLLQIVKAESPRAVLEIGTNRGGTTYLLTRQAADDATVATVDIELQNCRAIRSFARSNQQIVQIEGSSRDEHVVDRLRELFPVGLDVLMIDGDHSYAGARADFQLYSPWVRPGGLIIFHDIVMDNKARMGLDTGGWAGGVPDLWKELKAGYTHEELIAFPGQDGLGIGVLRTPVDGPTPIDS